MTTSQPDPVVLSECVADLRVLADRLFKEDRLHDMGAVSTAIVLLTEYNLIRKRDAAGM